MTPSQLKALRKDAGWTQARLAVQLRVHPLTIYRYEQGIRTIPPALGAHAERLLRDAIAELERIRHG